MDPNTVLEKLTEMARAIIEERDSDNEEGPILWADRADEMAELVLALNGWLSAGGFLPRAWCPLTTNNEG